MSSRFTVVTYNMFARSLGSSVIPWVLTVPPEAHALVERFKPDFNIKDWVKSVAAPEYKRHFHRNHASGDKDTMRGMWSATIDSQEQVPMCLKYVTCIGPDALQYPGERPAEEAYSSELQVALTLRGLLRREFDRDVADLLFTELVRNEEFFLWENRGPEIFELITRRSVAELFPMTRSQTLSDLITLLEVLSPHRARAFCWYPQTASHFFDQYDVYDGTCLYDGTISTTFGTALDQRGYQSLFFRSPHHHHSKLPGKNSHNAQRDESPCNFTPLSQELDCFWLGNAIRSSYFSARVSNHTQTTLSPSEILGLSKISTFSKKGFYTLHRIAQHR
jgi:hypothetical protein